MNTPLDPELLDKIQQIESRKPANQQLQVLADIATMMQELINLADDEKEAKESDVEQFGAVLLDIRESLKAIKDREDPESQDYATPVVEAVSNLEKSFSKALEKIDIKPVVNVPKQDIKVAAPNVNVAAPKIDLSGVEKLLKNDIPKAFQEAIKLIPKTEVAIPEAPDRWDEVLQWLQSIDTATRLKPQPGTMKVTTSTGGSVADVNLKQSNTILFAKVDTTASGDTQIVAAAGIGVKIKLLSCKLISNGTVSVKWRSGTTDLEGANPLAANSGYVLPASSPGQGHYLETAANTALNINLSGAVQVSGHISYYTE